MTTVKDLSDDDIANIKARIKRGEKYSDIASDYRLNQGRIADLKFGRIRPDVKAAKLAPDEPAPPPKGKSGSQMMLF
jgi:hypothetical protein